MKQSNNLNIHNNHYYILGLIRVIRKFYNYYVSPDKALVKRLTVLVGFIPANVNVFNLSFSHKSSSSPELYAIQNNERLEYLGDAILGTIVAEYLFRKYPNRDEGFLTKMRSKIVNRKVMNQIGDSMGLDLFIVHNNNSRLSRSMLGNALEALIGAVYLDVGYKKTQRFVFKKILKAHLDIEALETYDDNYKSQLLEWCQKNRKEVTYNVLDKFKMDNRDRFKVAVLIDGNKRADAEDFSKKAAEQKASHKALLKIGVLERED
ncbi:MAG: ribonuclease-3 [Cognaticolwellia sp.]